MAPEIISFMPNGDITLLLTRHVYREIDPIPPSSLLAPAPPEIDEDKLIEEALGIEPDAADADAEKEDESFLFFAPDAPGSNDGPMYPPAPRGRRGTWESEQRERSTSPPAGFWARLKRQSAVVEEPVIEAEAKSHPDATTEAESKEPTKERVLVSSHEVHCIVSSRHLILASKFFQVLLTGASTFATSLRLGHHVNISLPTVDLETMVILLNIVHGLSRKVPRQIDLGELSQLAVLARKLGMQDTVQFFSDTWIDAAQRDGLPKVYEAEATKIWWFIYVFWAFDRDSEFKEMTKLVQRECSNAVEDDVKDVPVPKLIIDTIRRDREFAIETALTVIHTLITRYVDGDTICDAPSDDDIKYACDAMVLGSLIKGSKKIGFWPRPVSPFEGKRFQDLATEVRGIRVLDVCGKGRRGTFGKNCHGLEDEIGKSMKDIEMGLDGLEVADYKIDNENFEEAWELLSPLPEPAVPEEKVEDSAEPLITVEDEGTETPNGHLTSQLADSKVSGPEWVPVSGKTSLGEIATDITGNLAGHSRSYWEEEPLGHPTQHGNRPEGKSASVPIPQSTIKESRVPPQDKTVSGQNTMQIRQPSPSKPIDPWDQRPLEFPVKHGNRAAELASAPINHVPVNGSRSSPQATLIAAQNYMQIRQQSSSTPKEPWEETFLESQTEHADQLEELVSAPVSQFPVNGRRPSPEDKQIAAQKYMQRREQSPVKPKDSWEERPLETLVEHRNQSEELASAPVGQFSNGTKSIPQEKQIAAQKYMQRREQSPIKPEYHHKPEDSANSFEVRESSVPPQLPPQRKEVPLRNYQNENLPENYPRSIEDLLALAQQSDDVRSGKSTRKDTATSTGYPPHPDKEPSRRQVFNNMERIHSPNRSTVGTVPEQYLENGDQESRDSRDLNLRQRIQSPPPQQQVVNRLRGENVDSQQRSRHSSPVSDSFPREPRILDRERTLTHQFSRDFQDSGARISPRNSGERVSRQDWDPSSNPVTSDSYRQETRSAVNRNAKVQREAVSPTVAERVVIEPRGEFKNGDVRNLSTKSPAREMHNATNGNKPTSVPKALTPQNTHYANKHTFNSANLYANTKQIPTPANPQALGGQSANYPESRRAELRTAPSPREETPNLLSDAKSLHSLALNSREQASPDSTANANSRDSTKESITEYTNGYETTQPSLSDNTPLRNKSQSPLREGNGYGKANPLAPATLPSLQPETNMDLDEVNDIMGRINEDDVKNTKDPITAGISITTDGEDTWAPPQNFKMRKSKKKFSTRF